MSFVNSNRQDSVSQSPLAETKDAWSNMIAQKRRRTEDDSEQDVTKENRMTGSNNNQILPRCSCNFLRIPANENTFHTEDWKTKQTSIYVPITEDIMVNLRTAEQISLLTGSFHVGDDSGIYTGSAEGHVLHLWRYDNTQRKLFVARSFFFTDLQGFTFVKRQLDDA